VKKKSAVEHSPLLWDQLKVTDIAENIDMTRSWVLMKMSYFFKSSSSIYTSQPSKLSRIMMSRMPF
jgi:hypothetical protein